MEKQLTEDQILERFDFDEHLLAEEIVRLKSEIFYYKNLEPNQDNDIKDEYMKTHFKN